MSQKFVKDGHVVETTLAREAVRLQSEGYLPADQPARRESPKPQPPAKNDQ